MSQTERIRVRIAPSPTGALHIGTARTALVNYLFAKQNKGDFIIRIEDTDSSRDSAEFENDILGGLAWLGLDADEPFIRQSDRTEIYKKVVEDLIAKDLAYRADGAVWFRIPEEPNEVEFHDLVRGKVSFAIRDLKDFVIERSDGSPLFFLTGVIDDNDMRITHVIRGEDHLSNTPRQILLAQALGFTTPIYAHIPLIFNADHSKMSKRKDPVSLNKDFRDQGYLPEAMVNFLALLGWHPSQKSEVGDRKSDEDVFSVGELIKQFDITRMQKGAAVFDKTKLDSINHHYITEKNDLELVSLLQKKGFTKEADQALVGRVVHIIKDRLKNLAEFEKLSKFAFCDPEVDAELVPFKTSGAEKAKQALEKVIEKLEAQKAAEYPGEIREILLSLVDDEFSTGDIFWSTRVALTGEKQSPPPEEVIWAVGVEKAVERIKNIIPKLKIEN